MRGIIQIDIQSLQRKKHQKRFFSFDYKREFNKVMSKQKTIKKGGYSTVGKNRRIDILGELQ